jgi:PEP-CTERM motif
LRCRAALRFGISVVRLDSQTSENLEIVLWPHPCTKSFRGGVCMGIVRKSVLAAMLVALLLATSGVLTSAYAAPLSAGGSLHINFPAPAGNSHLAADATFTLSSLNSTTAVLDILINNKSSGDTGFTDRLTAFGFLATPAPTSATWTSFVAGTNAFQNAGLDGIPSFKAIENVCTWVGNGCSGGNAGLIAGQHNEFLLTLSGSFGSTVDFSNFAIKWTDCTGCSFEILGTITRVPEPASLLLLGAGLLGVAGRSWQKRRKAK